MADILRSAPPTLSSTVTIGGRRYRGVDNGRANVLVPIDDPQAEARRRGMERFQDQVAHPLGSSLYGLAALAGASERTRDRALKAGGLIDEAMLAFAPVAAPRRTPQPLPQGQVAPPGWRRPNVQYRETNEHGQARGIDAWLEKSQLGVGERASRRLRPPGWQGNGNLFNEARGHLLARSLGGIGGRDLRNLVTLTHRGTNSPEMQNVERDVLRRVRDGELVEYRVTPFYDGPGRPPTWVLMTTRGSRGAPTARLIQNPAGIRK